HPKSEADRKEQLAWLESQITEADLEEILQDRKYSFTSSLIAEKGVLKNDTNQFAASGVADFYKQLTEIITNNAVTLKQDNPKRKFNQLILKIAGTKSDDETPSVTALYENIRNQLKLIGIKQS